MKKRIYRYDNVKAVLILLVVIGHMTSPYVSDSYMVRWITLWIYTFHMPAFIFISGLMHRRYITPGMKESGIKGETRLRSDRLLGFLMCGYGLKVVIFAARSLMGLSPVWDWTKEVGPPWYLFVMAEYELLFFLMRRIDAKVNPRLMVLLAFAVSAVTGYLDPYIDNTFGLVRMCNFLPIYALGYYLTPDSFLELVGGEWKKKAAWGIMLLSLLVCRFGGWRFYGIRKWFAARRPYEYFESSGVPSELGWLVRLAVWAAAILIAFALITIMPDRRLGYFTDIGSKTLQIYFWHRPIAYAMEKAGLLPALVCLFGGTYDGTVAGVTAGHAFGGGSLPMAAGLTVYLLTAAAVTILLSLKPFRHPAQELMSIGSLLGSRSR